MEQLIPKRLTALGHPHRLAVFRLLMRRYPDRVPATELALALGLKPNTLSTYVSALLQSGLITQERIGTSRRYAVNMDQARHTLDYLMRDCCRGRPEFCSPSALTAFTGTRAVTDKKHSVLFICTGNSARSIFAESILLTEAGDHFQTHSAGSKSYSELNPFALAVLEEKGYDICGLRSKNMSEFQGPDAPRIDFVFTVCNQATNEECPPGKSQTVSAHRAMPDPVQAQGSDAEKYLVFQKAFSALRKRITAFASLPIASLDRISLQKAVDEIGRTVRETAL